MTAKLTIGGTPSLGTTGKRQISCTMQVKDGQLRGQMWDLIKRITAGEQGLVDKAASHFDLTPDELGILRILEQNQSVPNGKLTTDPIHGRPAIVRPPSQ